MRKEPKGWTKPQNVRLECVEHWELVKQFQRLIGARP